LRRGWTTGACATAAAKAAYSALLGHGFPDPVEITLPRGGSAHFGLAEAGVQSESASAGVIKDAGDDPDVTHGCLVRATVRHNGLGQGVTFHAGEGVGTITLEGLQLPPGEAAINPVPRRMIAGALEEVAGHPPDVAVTISIPGGEVLAKRTMNGRLGIMGGLSILGTTGIVVPYSCSAWIHSIHRGIDVARAAGLEHIAAATGSTSERAVQVLHGLPEIALIDMGDFVGGTLKYLRRHPVPRLTLAGGFAKLAKLGQGALDLHSGRSRLDQERLALQAAVTGAPGSLVELIRSANTANQILGQALEAGYPIADLVAAETLAVAQATAGPSVRVDVIVVDRKGTIVGSA
jgi:cobalt-precorrin-5B (C1)-methyltransferase